MGGCQKFAIFCQFFVKIRNFHGRGLTCIGNSREGGANLLLEIPWERDKLYRKFQGERSIKMGFLDRGVRIKTAMAHLHKWRSAERYEGLGG